MTGSGVLETPPVNSRRSGAGRQPHARKTAVNAAITERVAVTLSTAAASGLITGKKERRLSGRLHQDLVAAAEAKSGLEGSDLLEYALAKVALEDDFADRLLARKGAISQEIDLGI